MKKKVDEGNEDTENTDNKKVSKKKNKWRHYERKKPAIGALLDEEVKKVEHPPKAVIFVQCTENS